MTALQVGNRLVELCKAQKNMQAVEELYDKNVESIEPWADESFPQVTKGIDGIKKKHEWWFSEVTYHSGDVKGPFIHGDDQFGAIFDMDVTMKSSNQRMKMTELAIYEVKNGKIVRERFYCPPMK
jgi:ketosteroid isomerase-like protein